MMTRRVLDDRLLGHVFLNSDFVNATVEADFDLALREGLKVKLEESPFLNIFPEEQLWATMQQMGRSPDESITREIGREILLRHS